MDLYNELGNSLRPHASLVSSGFTSEEAFEIMNSRLTPPWWPEHAPTYLTTEGWTFQKQYVSNKINHDYRDKKANRLIARCVEMQEAALAAGDEAMFYRYHDIFMRLIEYRKNLINRYVL